MQETALKIRLFGDPKLRKRSRLVERIGQSHRNILSQMAKLMYDNSGIGLAAPQVGINEFMVVADIGSGLYKLINPKVVKKEGRQSMEEGCLSIPGVCVKVNRARKILIKAQDESGKPLVIEAEDLLARVLQHEIDHLKGKLIIDYASFFERLKMKGKIEALKKRKKDEELPEPETKSCRVQL